MTCFQRIFRYNMILALWMIFVLISVTEIDGKLKGDHICQKEIVIPREVLKWELKNRTTRTYQWCMNVPPRCSEYFSSLVNETKIETINITQSIESCCDGFKEQNGLCVSHCENCSNGLCLNGTCICKNGWTGANCDSRSASITINSPDTTIASITSSTVSSTTTTTTTTKISTEITTPKPQKNASMYEEMVNLYKKYVTTTPTTPQFGEFEGSGGAIEDLIPSQEAVEDVDQDVEDNSRSIDTREFDVDFTHHNDSLKVDNTIEKLNSRSSTTLKSTAVLTKPSLDFKEDNIIIKDNILREIDDMIDTKFEKRSSLENLSENRKLTITTEPESKNLIYSICAASLTTFLILVIVVTLYAVRNSRKKVENNKGKKEVGTVAVYTTSIFHSPLPEPPTFDNPTYLATGTKVQDQDNKDNIEVQEFNVVFQKPMRNPTLDCKQYLYDHPPSTGSYRASSIVDTLSQYNVSQKSNPGVTTENVYDEISSTNLPVNQDNHQYANANLLRGTEWEERQKYVNSLYMNTCSRTKF